MNAVTAGKLALCICTGAVVGAGVNEARHNADKPRAAKSASKPVRKVVQFPCEPYIVQDQMLRDAQIPDSFQIEDMPQFASLGGTGPGGRGGDGVTNRTEPGGGGGGDGDDGDGGGNTRPIPEPAVLALFGLGVGTLIGARRRLLARPGKSS